MCVFWGESVCSEGEVCVCALRGKVCVFWGGGVCACAFLGESVCSDGKERVLIGQCVF